MNKRLRCTAFFILCMMTVAQIPLIAEEKKEDHTPVPYTKEEFPLWQRELRRFEILSWGYDMIRAAKHPKDPAYYPWPLKQVDKAIPLTEKEQLGVFLTAAGISITIALIDITYRAIKRSAAKKRLERENTLTEAPIQFISIAQSAKAESQALKLMTDAALAAGSIGGIVTLLAKVTASTPSVQSDKTDTVAQ